MPESPHTIRAYRGDLTQFARAGYTAGPMFRASDLVGEQGADLGGFSWRAA
ncbi:hypothetical protein QRX50_36650 [Amycolatopsis carbonis]|uniref:Uncharacterized protein n=1 Tax=Amycolatopsis carbonis TaxID=715471 RepID=A0A9Y2IB96_9PSEU|nr:hypothetical protein [Amycolatopsis sp. 2-15]WIX76912.1 hypothetical protein QRX50_36650 [Amycolatopsis sp. 2-15]